MGEEGQARKAPLVARDCKQSSFETRLHLRRDRQSATGPGDVDRWSATLGKILFGRVSTIERFQPACVHEWMSETTCFGIARIDPAFDFTPCSLEQFSPSTVTHVQIRQLLANPNWRAVDDECCVPCEDVG
jgi:hypothetical protein